MPLGLRSGGFAQHRHGDLDHHIMVQTNFDLEVAHTLERAVRHAYLRLSHLEALFAQTLGDVKVGDGAEQAAIDAGPTGKLQRKPIELLSERLCRRKLVGLNFFEFGATSLELFDGGVGGATGFALGYQEIGA